MRIYHNPRCGKSRQTLSILQEKGVKTEIVEYLKNPPSKEELKEILVKLNLPVEKIIRKGESIFKENYKGKVYTEDQWIHILVNNPILIERPIVVSGDKAVVGRPPENVLNLI